MSSRAFCNVFAYSDEVVVELAVGDRDRDLAVRSFQFEYCGDDAVRPKGGLEDEFREDVVEALAEAGYAIAE